jgi:hypothetical protein
MLIVITIRTTANRHFLSHPPHSHTHTVTHLTLTLFCSILLYFVLFYFVFSGAENVLSDREASDAIEVMRESEKKRPGQPWMIQVRDGEGRERGEGERERKGG